MTTLPAKEYAKIRELTERSIRKGYDNAKAEWREMALEVLYRTCCQRQTFTVNDFRKEVDALPVKTHDKRAMGGVVKVGVMLGWIEKTGDSIPSKVGHLVPIQIWKSKIYELTPAQQQELF